MIDPEPTVVIDGSALADAGPAGSWVAEQIGGSSVAAPSLAVFETANILRRQALRGTLDPNRSAGARCVVPAYATPGS